jgi:transcription-repair coupling factor (superfamily II helicase)
MEVRIETTYVNKVAERLSIYKKLNDCDTEESLLKWKKDLEDRFGPAPESVEELMDTMRLKWLGRDLAVEKMFLKKEIQRCYFVANQESAFYQSKAFTNILSHVQENPAKVTLAEKNGKLALTFKYTESVKRAIDNLSSVV